ncbi:MAG: cation diffusion facilitator family transporter [Bacillota bacterium]|nr:cation diffusion facilitator family transporter [Bacillota bacterium]MDW7684583.1 cation diffusion facilitator family transporter [Bacillota bacterium]
MSAPQRTVWRTMAGDVFLAVLKIMIGITVQSAALVAEAVHSTGGIAENLATLSGFRISRKWLSLCSCLAGLLWVGIGFKLTTGAIVSLRSGVVPGAAALYMIAACVAVKVGMYRYAGIAAGKTGGQLLYAEVRRHRTEIIFLSGILLAVIGARLGYPVFDSLAALIISVLVIRQGIATCRSGLGKLIELTPDEHRLSEIRQAVKSLPDVATLHCLRTHRQGQESQIEVYIGVHNELCVSKKHDVARNVKATLLRNFPELSRITVHVTPISKTWGRI